MSAMPTDFIGSKISLISKSEIRYEGTLYSLDLREATISLCKVRSFGTEDRPTDRPIPIKDEVFEFIVFRGSDIKSIDVLAPPQRGSTMPCGLPQDPAIVEVSQFTRGMSLGSQSHHGHHCHDQNCRDHPIRYSTQRQGVFDSLLRGSGRPHRGNQRRSSNDNGNQPDRSRNNGGRQSNRGERNPENRSRQEYRGGSSSGNAGNNERNQESRRSGRGNTPNRNNQGNNSNAANRNNRETSRNRSQQARQRGIIEPQQPPKVTFEDPFDFEKSNEELKTAMEKLKLAGDEENKDADASGSNVAEKKEEPLIYYDKDKFFDNISCEALERKQGYDFYDDFRKAGRVDWRAERKLNAETFGLTWNPNQPQRNQRNGNFGRPRNFRGFRGGMRYNYNRYNRNSSFGSGFNNGGNGNRGQP